MGLFGEGWAESRYAVGNTVTLLTVALVIILIMKAATRTYWREAARRVLQRKRAVVCFIVLSGYVALGLLDSIAWRDPLMADDGTAQVSADGERVLQPTGLTLLDRLDLATFGLSARAEKTFSAPMAGVAFGRETVRRDDGTTTRERPALLHPGRHPLGTDKVGDDVLWKALKGARTALIIGGFTTLLVVPFALFFGAVAGYSGRRVDDVITYIYTTLASIPSVLIIAAFMLIFGRGLFQLSFIMAVTSWTGLCRVIRGETLKVREQEFVQAARCLGVSGWRIVLRHVAPNVMHIVLISSVLRFSGLVLSEALLSYLNIGVGPGTASWGAMINDARFELSREPVIWWNLVAAFTFMFGLVLPANIFGDAVRDALDPRLRTG